MEGRVSNRWSVEDDLLERAAKDGFVDPPEWPRVLGRIIERLEEVAHKEFPAPSIPLASTVAAGPNESVPAQSEVAPSQDSSSQNSQTANKENTPPKSPSSRPLIPPFTTAPSAQTTEFTRTHPPNGTLPPQLLSLLSSIKSVLTKTFAHSPPHTIQRLSELVLRPRIHYRSLPSYLRALDRVVSVSSGADIFPLPSISLSSEGGGLLNGTSNTIGSVGSSTGLGSDESLGGALLTPIPWLRDQQGEVRTESTQTIDGPNGAGSIETVSISMNGITSPSRSPEQGESLRESGAVTQGELLRQEQEAGVVPVAQAVGRQTRSATARGLAEAEAESEEHPHARGPEEIGMEDMGPQDVSAKKGGFDAEAAIGRSMSSASAADERGNTSVTDDGLGKDNEDKDVVLADADGKAGNEDPGSDSGARTVSGDAVDSTAQ
ncbi:MAG: hypothetical protein M1812_003522 [Candelaria pacifica]|nr:MAG: hypothetical protein M1812_003522 [Candelaria pacifica]